MGHSGKIFFFMVFVLAAIPCGGPEAVNVASGQAGCQGCERTAFLERATSNLPYYKEHGQVLYASTLSRLSESLTTPCFHLINRAVVEDLARKGWPESGRALSQYRVPEYFFLADFSRAGAASGEATRLSLELVYNGEPNETVFKLSTDSPIEDYSSQVNRMYQNPDAVINQVKPIDEILRDFERRPATCEIKPDGGDETVPGASVDVALEDFRDEKGRPSRDFNRIVVEARHGRISGGVPVGEGASRQAFRIGDGTVRLQYLAPAECDPAEDEITVYSSCDILDPEKKPMETTGIDRKIASRKIKLVCAEGVLTFWYLYQSPKKYMEATIEIGLGELDFSLPYGVTGNMADYHPILYMKIRKAKALKEGLPGHGFRFYPFVDQIPKHLIVTNPKSRKVVGVLIWNNLLMFNWSDGTDGSMIQGCAPNLSNPTEGDGVIKASGGCTRNTPDGIESFKWTLNRVVPPKSGDPGLSHRPADRGLPGLQGRPDRTGAGLELRITE